MKSLHKPFALAAALLAALAVAAPAQAQRARVPAGCKSAEEIRALVTSTGEATPAEYKAVLETFACCSGDERELEIDRKTCPTFEAYKLLRTDKVKLPPIDSIFEELATHSSPMVRAAAFSDGAHAAHSAFLERDAIAPAAKKAMETETNPYALRALIGSASNSGNKMPEAGEFLKKMSEHDNSVLRRRATAALASPWSDKVPGVQNPSDLQ